MGNLHHEADVRHEKLRDDEFVGGIFAQVKNVFKSLLEFIGMFCKGICSMIWKIWKLLVDFGKWAYSHISKIVESLHIVPFIHLASSSDEAAAILEAVNGAPILAQSENLRTLVDHVHRSISPYSVALIVIGVVCSVIEIIYDTCQLLRGIDYYRTVTRLCLPMYEQVKGIFQMADFAKDIVDTPQAFRLNTVHIWDQLEFISEHYKQFQHKFARPEVLDIPNQVKKIQEGRTYSFGWLVARIIFQSVGSIIQFVSGQWWLVAINIFTAFLEMGTNLALKFLEEKTLDLYEAFNRVFSDIQFGEFSLNASFRITVGKLHAGHSVLGEQIPKMQDAMGMSIWEFFCFVASTIKNNIVNCISAIWHAITNPVETWNRFFNYAEDCLAAAWEVATTIVEKIKVALKALKRWFRSLCNPDP